jgi:four helix bundle protein
VFRQALEAAHAISAILTREPFVKDHRLRVQLAAASAAVAAQVAEGYGQLTDRHFAHYLAMSRGSCNEVRAHLAVASGRGYLADDEWRDLSERYTSLGKRLTRLIQHLRREDRRDRG